MDLRKKKTIRSIQNAFLKLISEKELSNIRVKELAELAEISKGTFYLHYHDVYDLAEQLQNDVINRVIEYIEHPGAVLDNHQLFTKELLEAFLAQQNLINILFSDSQDAIVPKRIEEAIKQRLMELVPDAFENPYVSISLTYQVYGGYYAFSHYNNKFGSRQVIDIIAEFSERMTNENGL